MLKPLTVMLALLPAAVLAEDDACGAVYTNADFVGEWEMTTGTGIVTDSAKSAIVPATTEGTGPVTITLDGKALTLKTEFTDFAMAVGEIDYETDAPEYSQLVPDGSDVSAEDVSLVVGCDWKRLQPVMARAEGQTPYGEDAVWQINGVVVTQNAEGEPTSIFGTFRVLGVGLDVQMTRTVVLTR